ncbi:peptidase G2 autoproteolytic cleavage domain-containing protein [Bacillus thuringiensis]|uniref:peptidase G2 autoproteolytic cleavage domain-containing protein n=1 Tax=Bacillus thuringiensis TaxID=1428 RepID=UPI0021E99762|nr:peptidase G2 autoproteolytic cleavage domain-containing protein [Bacillus thuringiensis]
MANISGYLNKILTAVFGKDVRGSIHDAIHAINAETIMTTLLSKETKKRQDNLESRWDAVVSETTDGAEVIEARIAVDGTKLQTLYNRLKYEQEQNQKQFEDMMKLIKREVHVDDFGAIPDGVTDSTEAFKAAMGHGYVKIILSAGIYMVNGIKLKNFTCLVGKGKGITVIKLQSDAPAGAFVIANDDIEEGNKYLYISDMTLDGSAKREGGVVQQPEGGSRGSGLSIHASSFVCVERVETKNTVLHGIDVTCAGLDYPYEGDGTWGFGPSRFIWIKDCETSDFGDDGITTHHSEYVWIEDCYSHDARNRGNQNGIEIDDGSRHVFLKDNHTARCYGGLEIKAHETASAPYDVVVNGHRSVEDVRSYNFRHIGHHKEADPDTLTAKGIVATNLVSIRPNNKLGFQNGAKPRALVISAYQGVVINGFSAIGDPASIEFIDQPVIAMQYKVRNIILNNINLKGFGTAKQDIYVIGSKNKADNITISNVNLLESAKIGIATGSDVRNVSISNVNAINTNGEALINTTNSNPQISHVVGEGYRVPMIIAGTEYDTFINMSNGGFRAASSSSGKIHNRGAVLGTSVSCSAPGDKTLVAASSSSHATGETAAVLASSGGSKAGNVRSVVIGSNNSQAGREGATSQNSAMVLASNSVVNDNSYTARGGFGLDTVPKTANTKWELDSLNGNIKASGAITGAQTWQDYAEYFESLDGKKIPTGTLVTLEGEKIRKANEGDFLLGAISETAGVVLGESTFTWQGKYLKNEFGGAVYEEKEVEVDGVVEKLKLPVENPYYNEKLSYLSRSNRDEWNVVGLVGQIFVRCDNTVRPGDTISAHNGIATKGQSNWRVMSITTPYDEEKGYGVALVFVR